MAVFSLWKSILIIPVILFFPMTSHYSLTVWKRAISVISNVISFLESFQFTFPKLASAHLKFQLATVRLQQHSSKSTKCCNRFCGHSSGIRNVSTLSFKWKHDFSNFWWQSCQGIQVPGHYPRQVPGRKNSCWNSLSATEIDLYSELYVLVFKSQIAYGDSKFIRQSPFYFQYC